MRRAHNHCGDDGADMAVFWDWPSIPQSPRTEDENILFKLALSGMQLIYGHDLFIVFKMKFMPAPPQELDDQGHFTVKDKHGKEKTLCWPYQGKGWCFTEDMVSNARGKVAASRFEFNQDNIEAIQYGLTEFVSNGVAIGPTAFARHLEGKIFSNSSDPDTVASMYVDTFEQSLRLTTSQQHGYIIFDSQMLQDYCEALGGFHNLKIFRAGACSFGSSAGFKHLLSTLAALTTLTQLLFLDCGLDDDSLHCFEGLRFVALVELNIIGASKMSIDQNSRFYAMHRIQNVLTDRGAEILAETLPITTPVLKSLLIGGITDVGVQSLRKALPDCAL